MNKSSFINHCNVQAEGQNAVWIRLFIFKVELGIKHCDYCGICATIVLSVLYVGKHMGGDIINMQKPKINNVNNHWITLTLKKT